MFKPTVLLLSLLASSAAQAATDPDYWTDDRDTVLQSDPDTTGAIVKERVIRERIERIDRYRKERVIVRPSAPTLPPPAVSLPVPTPQPCGWGVVQGLGVDPFGRLTALNLRSGPGNGFPNVVGPAGEALALLEGTPVRICGQQRSWLAVCVPVATGSCISGFVYTLYVTPSAPPATLPVGPTF